MSKIKNGKVSSKDKTTIVVNGAMMLSDDDILEIVTWYNESYKAGGLAREGEHEIVTEDNVALVDIDDYAIVKMDLYKQMREKNNNYLELLKYRATRARFWDAFSKTCMVTRLVVTILLLVGAL